MIYFVIKIMSKSFAYLVEKTNIDTCEVIYGIDSEPNPTQRTHSENITQKVIATSFASNYSLAIKKLRSKYKHLDLP